MSLSKIRDFLSQNKKAILLLVTALLFLFPDFAFAKTDAAAGNNAGLGNDLVGLVQLGLRFIAGVLGMLTSFVSIFLSPGWVNGEIFGMQDVLKNMWILISNIVYFAFAFILIAIAFMNIIGKGDKWELKQALPKFIVGVIMVPFSWFFVQFVISMTSLLTVSVLGLPYDSFSDTAAYKGVENEKICTNYEVNLGSEKSTKNNSNRNEFIKCKTPKENSEGSDDYATIGDLLSGKSNGNDKGSSIYSIVSIYTYSIMSVDKFDDLFKKDLSGVGLIETFLQLSLDAIFSLIFIVVYFILMVALFLALFTRGIGLWLYAMFSPLFGLFYFFGGEGGGELGKKFSLKEFFGLALVPVYVAAALSFGFLFLLVSSYSFQEDKSTIGQIVKVKSDKESEIKFAGFKFTVKGKISTSSQGTGPFFKDGKGGPVGKLILQLFGLAILWGSVMVALKSSTITEKVSSPIADFGKSVGDLVMKSPTYAPILPGGMSTQSLANVGSSAKNYYTNTKPSKAASAFMTKNHLFGNQGELVGAISDLKTALSKNKTGIDQNILDKTNNMLSKSGDLNTAHKNHEVVDNLLDVSKRLNISGFNKTDIMTNKNKYLELLRKIDEESEKINGLNFIKSVNNGQNIDLNDDKHYNNIYVSGNDKAKKNSSNNNNNIKLNFNTDKSIELGVIKKDDKGKEYDKDVVDYLVKGIRSDVGGEGKVTKKEMKKMLEDIDINEDASIEKLIDELGDDYFKKEKSKEKEKTNS